MHKFTTVDAHVAGQAVRLLVGGGPSVPGGTMEEKLAWLRGHGEPLRRMLMLEPRGHPGLHGAMFTEPERPKAHAGLLSMNAAGFPTVSGEAVIAAAMIARQQGLIHVDADELYIDTPAGVLTVCPVGDGWVGDMALTGFGGYVVSAGLAIRFGNRAIAVDVAFGGQFFAIADAEAVGIPVDGDHAPELIRAAGRLCEVIDAALHQTRPNLSRLHGVIFTAPAQQEGHLRSATVLEGGVLHRSPGVTSTCALTAVFDAMGLMQGEGRFTHEGLLGTTLQARVISRQTAGDISFVVPLIEGSAFITGWHEFDVDDRDPLKNGYLVGSTAAT